MRRSSCARIASALLAFAGGVAAGAASRPAGPGSAEATPVTEASEQTLAGLTFRVPAGFTPKDATEEPVESPIPDEPPTVEYFRSFADRAGHGIYVFAWDGAPVRDRGPMAATERWDATVGGQQATVSLTSMFFGRPQCVLAAHFEGPAPSRNRYMIYTTLVDRPAFTALLASVRFAGAAEHWTIEFSERLQGGAESLTFRDGDWQEDWGDAAFYGPAFYAWSGATSGSQAHRDRARTAYERNLAIVEDADLLAGDLNEIVMSALGLIEYVAATEDGGALPAVDALIDDVDTMIDLLGGLLEADMVPGWAMETYGPTTLNGLVGLLNLQRAAVRDNERRDQYVPWAEALAAAITARSWDGAVYAFSDDRPGLFLYPNVTMIALYARLFQLTGSASHRDQAAAIHRGIQPLKVTPETGYAGPGRYRSPYSAQEMGAQTDDYTTLSSANLLMMALLLLHEITGHAAYVEEVDVVLDFTRDQLQGTWCLSQVHAASCAPACVEATPVCVAASCVADACACGVLHHWMDGRVALPTDPAFFCSGCNLQLLYVLWYRQHWGHAVP